VEISNTHTIRKISWEFVIENVKIRQRLVKLWPKVSCFLRQCISVACRQRASIGLCTTNELRKLLDSINSRLIFCYSSSRRFTYC